MRTMMGLISGEFRRLVIYKILPISLAVSFMWVIIFLFISREDASYIAPLLLFVDITMMSIMLIGASHHLEKQEGTIKSMMVMPVSLKQILAAKMVSAMFLGLESFIVISTALYIIHGITFNYAMMLLVVLVAGVVHAAIGFSLAHNSKDFGSMLGWLMAYIFPFTVPSVLFSFGIISDQYEWMLMLSPSHAASHLVNSTFTGAYEAAKVIPASVYLVILTMVLMHYVVYPKFKQNAVRG